MFTLQVLAEVSGKPSAGKGSLPQNPAAPARGKVMRICPKLLVLSDTGNDAALQEAQALRRCGFTMCTLTDPAASAPDAPDLVAAIPSAGLVSELALGLEVRPMAAAILAALRSGKPVYMDFSALKDCASPALAALYAGYADRLREFGVTEIFPGHYEAVVAKKSDAPEETVSRPAAGGGRTVITAQDVLSFTGSSWQVPEDAIITPLARDTARKRGVVIEKVHSRRD